MNIWVFTNKKLLLMLIVVLIGASIGGVILYRTHKTPTPPEALVPPGISPEAVKAKCLENVSKMTEEQLIEKINDLAVQNEGSQQLNEARRQMTGYLFCKFNTSDKSEKTYEEIKTLIEKLTIRTPKRKESALKNLTDSYSQKKITNITLLMAGDLDFICPAGEENVDIVKSCREAEAKKKGYILPAKSMCINFCDIIKSYTDKPDLFASEILNYPSGEKDGEYFRKAVFAFRFNGLDAALNTCKKAPDPDYRDYCLEQIINNNEIINRKNEEKESCNLKRESLFQLICEPDILPRSATLNRK